MPALILPQVNSGISTDELGDVVAKGFKDIEWLTSGFMDSKNIRNIAGFNVGNTQLKHISGIVGMSGADPANNNAIRFWSGNANPAIASFRVTQGGIATMVSAVISSVASGERVVIDATGLHTYDASGVERLTIGTAPVDGVKAITGRDATGVAQSVYTYNTAPADGANRTGQFITAHSCYMLFDSAGDIRMQDAGSKGFRTSNSGYPEMNDGFGWVSIQKAFSGVTGTVYVSSTSGGPATTPITFSNGVRTS